MLVGNPFISHPCQNIWRLNLCQKKVQRLISKMINLFRVFVEQSLQISSAEYSQIRNFRDSFLSSSFKARLQEDNNEIICNLKKADQLKLTQETQKVNKVLKYIRTSNITETNNLIKAASMVVAENMGMDVRKKNANRSDKKEPWWKRRI